MVPGWRYPAVICGLPLYEYEHMAGWAVVERHEASEITLLCDQHHRERTSGLLPIDRVIAANKEPHNLRAGVSKPYDLHFEGEDCEIVIGGDKYKTRDAGYGTQLVPLSIDDTPMIAFLLGDGHLLLNLNLFDEFNQIVLRIINNQLAQSVSPWDIQFIGRNLVIREAARKILIDLAFEPPNRVVLRRGRFLRNGVEVLVRPDRVVVANNNMRMGGNSYENMPTIITVGPHPSGLRGFVNMPQVPRYAGDRVETEAWIRENLGDPG